MGVVRLSDIGLRIDVRLLTEGGLLIDVSPRMRVCLLMGRSCAAGEISLRAGCLPRQLPLIIMRMARDDMETLCGRESGVTWWVDLL
jgi:hypothetical protein